MGTDIYGGIEVRHPYAGTPDHEGDTWITAMDLWPLYDQTDYAAFGLLFGVRNYAEFRPLAAFRGLPDDLSSERRADLAAGVAAGHMDGATWIGWTEVAAIDQTTRPEHFTGRLTWRTLPYPHRLDQRFVPDAWPAEVLAVVGPPPPGLDRTSRSSEWTAGQVRCTYEPLTAGVVLGEGTHWPHVFSVMKALAGRFGEDGVRLVVAFD